jgi:DNA-directed RNA polymerase specialized sigma24 family protein
MAPVDRDLYRRIYELREIDGVQWSQIARRLEIPESTLARIRLRALEEGRARKEANGRVTWLPPRT